jgi:hypothetical protein
MRYWLGTLVVLLVYTAVGAAVGYAVGWAYERYTYALDVNSWEDLGGAAIGALLGFAVGALRRTEHQAVI